MGSESSADRSMLEAILGGDGRMWKQYSSAIPGERVFQIIGIATSAAVFRKWSEDPSLQTVVDYVAEIDRRFPSELPVARATLESVIRGIFGETDLIDGMSSQDIVVAEILITRSIGFDILTSDAQRNSYFDEVLAAVD